MGKKFIEAGHLVTAFMVGWLIGVLSIGFWLSGEIDKIKASAQQDVNRLKQELSSLESKTK